MHDRAGLPPRKTLGKLTHVLGVIAWLLLIAGTLGVALLYVLAGFVAYCFAQSAWIAYIRGTAVRITADQIPDLHQRLEYCSQILGVDPVPEAYILHGNGAFNAFATRFFGRNFVIIFSDFPGKYLPSSCRDREGNNRPAPPKQGANIGMWERSLAQGTYNGCVRSRTKDDPNGAETFCECLVYKLARVVTQADMEREPTSDETKQAIQTASQACVDR